MKGLRLKTCASVYDFLKHNVRDRVWELEIAQMRLALETRRLKLQETEQNIKEKSNVA